MPTWFALRTWFLYPDITISNDEGFNRRLMFQQQTTTVSTSDQGFNRRPGFRQTTRVAPSYTTEFAISSQT